MLEFSSINGVTAIASILGSVLTAGIIIGVFRSLILSHSRQIEQHERTLKAIVGNATIEPMFIKPADCGARERSTESKLIELKTTVDGHTKKLRSLENFARWMLVSKENLDLKQVNEILNGDS